MRARRRQRSGQGDGRLRADRVALAPRLARQGVQGLQEVARSGRPRRIGAAQRLELLSLACERAEPQGRASPTLDELVDRAIERGVVSQLSRSHLQHGQQAGGLATSPCSMARSTNSSSVGEARPCGSARLARQGQQFQPLRRADTPGSARARHFLQALNTLTEQVRAPCNTVCTETPVACEIAVVVSPAWAISAICARTTCRCSAVPRRVNNSSVLRSSRESLIACACRPGPMHRSLLQHPI